MPHLQSLDADAGMRADAGPRDANATLSESPSEIAVGAPSHALIVRRYCAAMARAVLRASQACGCEDDDEETLEDRFVASCSTWLLYDSDLTYAPRLEVDEAALATCLAGLEQRLSTCERVRVDPSCDVNRLFIVPDSYGVPGYTAEFFGRPEGEPCVLGADEGEGFDANFVCASGLECVLGHCQRVHEDRCPTSETCVEGAVCMFAEDGALIGCRLGFCEEAFELPPGYVRG